MEIGFHSNGSKNTSFTLPIQQSLFDFTEKRRRLVGFYHIT